MKCFISATRIFFFISLILFQTKIFAQEDKEKDHWPKYKFGGGPDTTYGKGGKVHIDTMFAKDGSTVIHRGYWDKDGNYRQSTDEFYNAKEGTTNTQTEYYDKNNKKTKVTSVTKDRMGNETYNRDEFYKDGELDSGDEYYDVPGVKEKMHKRYNKEKKIWEPVEKTNGKENKNNEEEKKNDPDVTGYLFLGPSLIIEDNGYDHFNTYGGTVAYERPLEKHFGVTGQIGIYFGSDNNVDYRKIEVLAGVSFFPQTPGKLFFSPHILAGVSNVKSKAGTYSSGSSSFAAEAGADVGMPVSRNIIADGRIDYNPTFPKGGVKNNFWFSAGVMIKL